MEQIRFDKKFTLDSLGLDKKARKAAVDAHPKEQEIVNVLALVTGKKVEPSKLDPTKTNTRFLGQFECVNLLNGEKGYYSEGFFPGPAEAYLSASKDAAGDGAITVGFTILIGEDKAPNSATGYKFAVKAWVDKAAADPFKTLRPLLPAPKKEAKPDKK